MKTAALIKRSDAVRFVMFADLETMARSERFELPTLGFEVRCSIQLSYERVAFD